LSLFKKASRKRVFLKVGLMGASGSGKTRSALELAKGLAKGGPIAVIDTENGSASLYSHVTEFDVADIEPPFSPEKYIAAIQQAEEAGYKVIIIDSFSHAWKYLLDRKEQLDQRGGKQNQYANWGPVKAEADELKNAILQSRIHVIACMRAKTDYSQEGGKVQKVGLAAIQEPDVEYEFTTVFQLDMAHNASQTKDRTGLFGNRIFRIDSKTGDTFLNWLDSAEVQEIAERPSPVQEDAAKPRGDVASQPRPKGDPELKAIREAWGFTAEEWNAFLDGRPAVMGAGIVKAAHAVGIQSLSAAQEWNRSERSAAMTAALNFYKPTPPEIDELAEICKDSDLPITFAKAITQAHKGKLADFETVIEWAGSGFPNLEKPELVGETEDPFADKTQEALIV